MEERVVEDGMENFSVLLDTVPGLAFTFQVFSSSKVYSVIHNFGGP